jgi:alpha-beta hydrolase superfamily lysophospholipase
MAAAVQLAMHHLQDKAGNQPLYIVGYSNGAALAVRYALETLDDKTLPSVDRMVLLSPEIGVIPLAALAIWQARLGHLLGLQKLEWNSILPEYEPYKYGSFAVNGGDLSYRLTVENRKRLTELKGTEKLKKFPPVLAFQSAVDKTVSMKAVVEVLFRQLPQNDHELMLFDINRSRELEMVLKSDPKPYVASLFKAPGLPFTLSFFTNTTDAAPRIVIRSKEAGQSAVNETFPNLKWPEHVYSLSHVALPFPADDLIYGGDVSADSPGLQLGNLAMRGERDTLQIPASTMLRIRWNPFYDFMENRLLEFLSLKD